MYRNPAILPVFALFLPSLALAQCDSLDIRLFNFEKAESLHKLTHKFIEYLDFPPCCALIIVQNVSFKDVWGVDPKQMQGFTVQGDSINGFATVQVFMDKTLNLLEQIQVLAHELVHVKQFLSRQLLVKAKKQLYWLGQHYPDYKNIPYNDRPWEQEACLNGKHLFQMVNFASTQEAFAFKSELILAFPIKP